MDVHLTLRRPGQSTAGPTQPLRWPYFLTTRAFCVAGIDVADVIIADAFQRAKADGFRNECRHLAGLGAPDPDALT